MTDSRRVFSHHIPKTAGSSFRQVLINVYGEARVSQKITGFKVSEAVFAYPACLTISGHMRVMPGDRLPAGYYAVTVLRDPMERFISEFFFSKQDLRAFRSDLQDMKSMDASVPGKIRRAVGLRLESTGRDALWRGAARADEKRYCSALSDQVRH